jgi:hypothetical protein
VSDDLFGFVMAGAAIGFGVVCAFWGIMHNSVAPAGMGALAIVAGLYLWTTLRQERRR